jgi:mannose-1-phosphate guanylyltransferase/phosphomannomutase
VGFVGDGQGGFIFPKFQPAFDAMYAIAHILEMLALNNTSMGQFWEQQGQPIHMLHRRVPCAWGKKGQVMRLAQTVQDGAKIELMDGVKLHFNDGWVLVLPDGNEAYCHLWTEGKTELITKKFIEDFSKKVQDWQEIVDEDLTPTNGAIAAPVSTSVKAKDKAQGTLFS